MAYDRAENKLDKLKYKRSIERERTYLPRHAVGYKHGYQDPRFYEPRH